MGPSQAGRVGERLTARARLFFFFFFNQSDCIDCGARGGRTQNPGALHSTGVTEGAGLKPPELGGRIIRVPASCAGSVVSQK